MLIEKINNESFIVKDIDYIIKECLSKYKYKNNILIPRQDILIREMICNEVLSIFLTKQKVFNNSLIPITTIKIPLKEFINNEILTFKEDITITVAILQTDNGEEIYTYNILDTL